MCDDQIFFSYFEVEARQENEIKKMWITSTCKKKVPQFKKLTSKSKKKKKKTGLVTQLQSFFFPLLLSYLSDKTRQQRFSGCKPE